MFGPRRDFEPTIFGILAQRSTNSATLGVPINTRITPKTANKFDVPPNHGIISSTLPPSLQSVY